MKSLTAPDVQAFVERVRGLNRTSQHELHGFFERDQSVSVARAPGRLDVMGGIADYSGSLVLQLPIHEAALVAAQRTEQEDWLIASLPASDGDPLRSVRLTKSERLGFDNYSAAQQWFQQDASKAWAAYLAGTVLVLGHELGADINCGIRILVRSDVPEAKGVSSSAALEVAAMRAVAHQLGIAIDGAEAAIVSDCREPCGRSTLRNHGPDDVRTRSYQQALGALVPARRNPRVCDHSRFDRLVGHRFRYPARCQRKRLYLRSDRCFHGISNDCFIGGLGCRGNRRRLRGRY